MRALDSRLRKLESRPGALGQVVYLFNTWDGTIGAEVERVRKERGEDARVVIVSWQPPDVVDPNDEPWLPGERRDHG